MSQEIERWPAAGDASSRIQRRKKQPISSIHGENPLSIASSSSQSQAADGLDLCMMLDQRGKKEQIFQSDWRTRWALGKKTPLIKREGMFVSDDMTPERLGVWLEEKEERFSLEFFFFSLSFYQEERERVRGVRKRHLQVFHPKAHQIRSCTNKENADQRT